MQSRRMIMLRQSIYCYSTDSTGSTIEQTKTRLRNRKRRKPTTNNTDQKLSHAARENAVPSSRVARMINYGGLVAGLGINAVTERIKKQVGFTPKAPLVEGGYLKEADVEKIVETLCKVRGAALKLGQMMSIQDNNFVPPEVQQMFDRVRANADFMPEWQIKRMMREELGENWRGKFAHFNMKPFAAASIGQVHQATTHDGQSVAVKVQYPGVAESIDSDIDTLLSILLFSKLLPEGLFLEKAADVARKELSWEVDYIREAQCSQQFKDFLAGDDDIYIPSTFLELSSKRVLTTELIQGVPLDQVADMDQQTRDRVALSVLNLSLRELFEFQFMQTDPNWSNYFYNQNTQQLCLLDFGASRKYDKQFVDTYIQVIEGAARQDREQMCQLLTKLGFQTGYETKEVINANIDAVTALGSPFSHDTDFDFSKQDITLKIRHLFPLMYRNRLVPPPEESYSLHRKLSGSFLLSAKLNAKINCHRAFQNIYENYKFGVV